jgi:hypothetical protein
MKAALPIRNMKRKKSGALGTASAPIITERRPVNI